MNINNQLSQLFDAAMSEKNIGNGSIIKSIIIHPKKISVFGTKDFKNEITTIPMDIKLATIERFINNYPKIVPIIDTVSENVDGAFIEKRKLVGLRRMSVSVSAKQEVSENQTMTTVNVREIVIHNLYDPENRDYFKSKSGEAHEKDIYVQSLGVSDKIVTKLLLSGFTEGFVTSKEQEIYGVSNGITKYLGSIPDKKVDNIIRVLNYIEASHSYKEYSKDDNSVKYYKIPRLMGINYDKKSINHILNQKKGVIYFSNCLGEDFFKEILQNTKEIKRVMYLGTSYATTNPKLLVDADKDQPSDWSLISRAKYEIIVISNEIDITVEEILSLAEKSLVIVMRNFEDLKDFSSYINSVSSGETLKLLLEKVKFIGNLYNKGGIIPNIAIKRLIQEKSLINLDKISFNPQIEIKSQSNEGYKNFEEVFSSIIQTFKDSADEIILGSGKHLKIRKGKELNTTALAFDQSTIFRLLLEISDDSKDILDDLNKKGYHMSLIKDKNNNKVRLTVVNSQDEVKLTIKYIDKHVDIIQNELENVVNKVTSIDTGCILINSLPGEGKTTVLKSLIPHVNNLKKVRILVIDDKYEIIPECFDNRDVMDSPDTETIKLSSRDNVIILRHGINYTSEEKLVNLIDYVKPDVLMINSNLSPRGIYELSEILSSKQLVIITNNNASLVSLLETINTLPDQDSKHVFEYFQRNLKLSIGQRLVFGENERKYYPLKEIITFETLQKLSYKPFDAGKITNSIVKSNNSYMKDLDELRNKETIDESVYYLYDNLEKTVEKSIEHTKKYLDEN